MCDSIHEKIQYRHLGYDTLTHENVLETFKTLKIIYRVVDAVCMYVIIHFVFVCQPKEIALYILSSTSSFVEMKMLLKKIQRRVQIRKLYGRKIIVEAKEIFIECKSFKCLRQAYFALDTQLPCYIYLLETPSVRYNSSYSSLHVSNPRNWIIFLAMCWSWNEFIKCALVSRIMTHFDSNGHDLKCLFEGKYIFQLIVDKIDILAKHTELGKGTDE